MEQDDDIRTINKNRQTREEVRRRNREIMEKANAELRDGKAESGLNTLSGGFGGKKDLSRLSLIKRGRDGSQSFLCDFKFHTATPELAFAPLRVDLNIDPSSFSELNLESSEQMFSDCLKATCMVDEVSTTFLDLVNPEEAYPSGSSALDPRDEALLSNDLAVGATTEATATNDEGIYTGHFLRKPQLMSNDLFAEGGLSGGRKTSSKFSMVGRGGEHGRSLSPEGFDLITEEFSLVKDTIDRPFLSGQVIENPIIKKTMRAKRVLSLIPDVSDGELMQFKFDEKVAIQKPLDLVMTQDYGLYEAAMRQADDFPRIYKKKRQLVLANRSNGAEEFYLIRIPSGVEDNIQSCFVKPVGSKILLKKDIRVAQSAVTAKEIKLSIANQ